MSWLGFSLLALYDAPASSTLQSILGDFYKFAEGNCAFVRAQFSAYIGCGHWREGYPAAKQRPLTVAT